MNREAEAREVSAGSTEGDTCPCGHGWGRHVSLSSGRMCAGTAVPGEFANCEYVGVHGVPADPPEPVAGDLRAALERLFIEKPGDGEDIGYNRAVADALNRYDALVPHNASVHVSKVCVADEGSCFDRDCPKHGDDR